VGPSGVTNHCQFEVPLVLWSLGRLHFGNWNLFEAKILFSRHFCFFWGGGQFQHFISASCTHANNFRVYTIKCLINENLFMYLKLQSTCLYGMFDVIHLSVFGVCCRDCSVNATAVLSDEEDRKNATRAVHGEKNRRWIYFEHY
jgi:hypothetical protein